MRRALLSLIVLAAIAPASASADFAPVDKPGPPLSVPQAALDASMTCTGNVAGATRAPVLLVPATAVNPHANYSWNWEPALSALNIPWCTVELPGNSMGDIQVAGEYVVHAIRKMYAVAGRKIAIIGHSQGGMLPRWALRFWPDTRGMVDDQIGFAGSNHGTVVAAPVCLPGCSPAFQQQRSDSEFTKALNSGQETFPGISYTEVYTHTDWVVVPNLDSSGSSSLHGGGGDISNVAVQDICPLDLNEHLLLGTIDPVAYALAIDALTHPGPANPSRVAAGVCLQGLMPGVNPLTFATDLASAATVLATTIATYPHVSSEPPLACYVLATGCPGATGSTAGKRVKSCRKAKKRRGRALTNKRKRCKRKAPKRRKQPL
ncbi:MAG: hypothetical protein QOD60_2213 [Solirubrobacterales bacterium]|nr:hypothetical protein [Solirubrobacterales bacterium]